VKPVLVDTSVWRRFFSGGAAAKALGGLLEEDGVVLTHGWVLGELMLGGLAEREEKLLRRLPTAPLVAESEVLEFVRHRRLARRGIGWVDANLLASALVASASLWTLDVALAALAAELKLSPDLGR
jgi:predicted nucleic acid-binding protein